MIEAPFTLFGELVFTLVSGAIEIATTVLVASFRPWRYVLSPNYRASITSQFQTGSSVVKWWYLTWGAIAIGASIAVVGITILLLAKVSTVNREESSKHPILEAAAKTALAKHRQAASEVHREP